MNEFHAMALCTLLGMASCSGGKQAELAELQKTKDVLNTRVTTCLDERNALLARVGTLRNESAALASDDIATEISQLEADVRTMEKDKADAVAARDEAAKILETLKNR